MALAVALVALLVCPALAQPGAGTRPPLRVLSEESVQKDLKLTSQQVKRVAEEFKKLREKTEELQDLEKDERSKKMQELIKEADKTVADILSPSQLKRFKQINLQTQGVRSLYSPALAKELGVTEEQRRKIKEIKDATDKEKMDLRQLGQFVGKEARQKMKEINKRADEKIFQLLTADQKAKWKEMIGEPFKGEITFGPPGSASREEKDKP